MKDRARPFSKKHRHIWLTVTGGMIVIMAINVALGWWVYTERGDPNPPAQYRPIPKVDIPLDAGFDAP